MNLNWGLYVNWIPMWIEDCIEAHVDGLCVSFEWRMIWIRLDLSSSTYFSLNVFSLVSMIMRRKEGTQQWTGLGQKWTQIRTYLTMLNEWWRRGRWTMCFSLPLNTITREGNLFSSSCLCSCSHFLSSYMVKGCRCQLKAPFPSPSLLFPTPDWLPTPTHSWHHRLEAHHLKQRFISKIFPSKISPQSW